ncbi:MAG TPA: DUF3311 domain-containing protein [Candidatus Baltobacteraceae bacterium]|jgi:hypothetical protein|nr:DUF3311 domain-containing protein [Candidatus Baltobacteraceae bacterium]
MVPLRAVLAAIPVAALTVAVPLVNRVDPRIFGLPFVLFWILAWVFLTPLFLLAVGRLERRW